MARKKTRLTGAKSSQGGLLAVAALVLCIVTFLVRNDATGCANGPPLDEGDDPNQVATIPADSPPGTVTDHYEQSAAAAIPGKFVYADATTETVAPPDYFQAPLPQSEEDFRDLANDHPRFAPRSHIADGLGTGNQQMIRRVLRVMDADSARMAAIADRYGLLTVALLTPSGCTAARKLQKSPEPEAQLLGNELLVNCNSVDSSTRATQHAPAATDRELTTCIQRRSLARFERAFCLTRLARRNRGAARRSVASLTRSDTPPPLELLTMANNVTRFRSAADIVPELQRRGFFGQFPSEGEPYLGVAQALKAADKMRVFDTGNVGNDTLMRQLAAMDASTFDGAIFEEVLPVHVQQQEQSKRPIIEVEGLPDDGTALFIYLRGKRYGAIAQRHARFYDVRTVIGLLNAVARDQKSQSRFLSLFTASREAKVIVGPAAALTELHKDGLVSDDGGLSAAAIGREVSRQLDRELSIPHH